MKKGESQTPPGPPLHRAEHVFRLFERLKLSWLLANLPPTAVWANYVFVNSLATIGLLALLAFLTHNPFVIPSLGPTAYLFFFTPLAETASPRNAVLGHAIALCCGFAAFSVTGMSHLPRSTFRDLLAACFVGGAFPITHRGHHGASAHQPSACRCDHHDRFARDHLQARISRDD
jgi:hypothetical protein